MKDLLPQELLHDLLQETGALGQGQASRLVKSVSTFKPFRVVQKTQTDFNVTSFEPGFDNMVELFQKDWRKNFVDGCDIARREAVLVNLKKYRFREESIVSFLQSNLVAEPFLVLFSPKAYFYILNRYLGGGSVKNEREAVRQLTAIELSILERLCLSACTNFTAGFEEVFPTELKMRQLNVNEDGQREFLKADYLVVEFLMNIEGAKYQFAMGLPMSYLKFVKKQLDKNDSTEQKKSDPAWQRAVTDTVLDANVDLRINIGEFTVPFEKSLGLKPGDVFPWEKYGPQVVISILERPRLVGTIGALGENYAIKVDEILS